MTPSLLHPHPPCQASTAFDAPDSVELLFGPELLTAERRLQTALGCLVVAPGRLWRAAGFKLAPIGTGRKYIDGVLVPVETPEPDYDAYPC